MITWKRLGELVRYVTTGAFCASLNVVISIFLTEYFGLHYLVSLTICSAIVIVVGFFLSRSWTFRKRGPAIVTEFFRYMLVTGVNVVIGLCLCAFLVEVVHIPYAYSIAIIAVAFAPVNYVVHRAWTFGLSWLHGE